jgi:hypothetical protein
VLHPARGPGRTFVQGANLAERNRGDRPTDSLATGARQSSRGRPLDSRPQALARV